AGVRFVNGEWIGITRGPDGREYGQYSFESPTSKLVAALTWEDRDVLRFVLVENWLEAKLLNDPQREKYFVYDIKVPGDSTQVPEELNKTVMTRTEFEVWADDK